MKKKSADKFKFLYEEMTDLELKVNSLEDELGCQNCCCSENEDWIERLKFEQREFLKKIENLENLVYELEKKLNNKNGRSNPSGNV